MKMSLHDFIAEMWDSYETAPFQDCWLLDWQSECFMYSIKHFLPYYVTKDWIDDKTYANIKLETGGICPVRDKIFNGEHVRNHDWNMPPRHSKTTVIGVCGPVWAGINTPMSVATVSHNSKLSSETNEKRLKLLQSEKFKYYFKDDVGLRLSKQSATNIRLVNGAQMYAVCQTSFTGFGGDCFPVGTKILTPFGDKNIEELLDNDKIISYNTKCSKYELSTIQATRRLIDNEFIRITTADGRTIESTPDHRYWVVGKGYVSANKLTEKDILESSDSFRSKLSDMWKQNDGCPKDMSKMYIEDMELQINTSVRKMWENIPEKDLRLFILATRRLYSYLLRKSVQLPDEQHTQTKTVKMSDVWKFISVKWSKVLLGRVQKELLSTKVDGETIISSLLSDLWGTDNISQEIKILFEGLCKQSTLNTNDESRELTLYRWEKLSDSIFKVGGTSNNERWLSLSDLWRILKISSIYERRFLSCKTEFGSTSYRPEQIQQFIRQFSNIMYELPYQVTQKQRISKITRFTDKKVVYDIQTSRNHNFFANGVLVHNCIIADDLISADNAAKDMQILRNVREFFKQTLPTRLNTKKTGVIWHVQQRLAPGDISGMIADSQELSSVYSHTELEAISTRNVTLIYPCTGRVKEIRKGDLLWPERFGDYTSLKMETGPIVFDTQYQQNAKNTDLTIIKESDIHYINDEDYEQFKLTAETQYASHDCPVKEKESSDYHGYVGGYGRGNQLLIDDGWEEHLGYVKEKQLMITKQQISPAILQILEDKANGAALLQDLRLDVPGLVPFNPGTNSKKQRLELASVYVNSGAVIFKKCPATDYLIKQLLDFPFVDHDDIVDAFSQLILYHFTQRKAGVYTNCFTFQNIINSADVKSGDELYGVTINGDHIKVLQIYMQRDGSIIAQQEWQMRGLESFEDFCSKFKSMPMMIDCSYENTISKLIRNGNVTFIQFVDDKREASIHSLKVGFYKKKILVNKQCSQTINDISKLRISDSSLERGDQKLNTFDEGLAGCLRGVVQYFLGTDVVW